MSGEGQKWGRWRTGGAGSVAPQSALLSVSAVWCLVATIICSAPSLAVVLDIAPGSDCKRLFVNTKPSEFADDVPGLEPDVTPVNQQSDRPTQGLLTVRAIKYVPRPIGFSGDGEGVDLYVEEFAHLFERDLAIMSEVLGANAVRLAPWDIKKDHSTFFKACRRHNIFVIPTFDFSYFFSDALRSRAFDERQSEVWNGFVHFVLNAKRDAGDADDLIILWSLNHGLFLNETSDAGPRSESLFNEVRDEYFELVRTVRQAQWKVECGSVDSSSSCEGDKFPRPLGLPLLLDSKARSDNIGWYLGFSETVWGTWPRDAASVGLTDAQFNHLRPLGAFDAWILETLPPTNSEAPGSVLGDAGSANQTMRSSDSGYIWRNVSSQRCCSPLELAGDELNGCRDLGGCTYPTQKLTLLQYGFAAQTLSPFAELHVDAGMQQKNLMSVWRGSSNLSSSCVAAGSVIDEWADDWSRYQESGCAGSPFMHPPSGSCDMQNPSLPRHYEWYGLNGQYSFLWWHCVDPRYHSDHPAETKCGDKDTVDACAFTFADLTTLTGSSHLWGRLGFGAYCTTLAETSWRLCLTLTLLALAFGIELCRCFCSVWRRKGARAPSGRSRNNFALLGASSSSTPLTPQITHAAPSSLSVETLAELSIPDMFRDDLGSEPVVRLRLRSRSVLSDGRASLSKEQLRVHLEAHVKVQCLRLIAQIRSEAEAVLEASRATSCKLDLKTCEEVAMSNVYVRAMEGYLSWLDSQQNSSLPGAKDRINAMLGTKRKSWVLFVESALLRIVESLGEHALHAPELLALLYHNIRWASPHRVDGILTDTPEFDLSFDVLHAGLEAMRNNLNPLKGGVNFDDLNDYGEGRIVGHDDKDRIRKTYRESKSWYVVVDLLSNFYPVFTVKTWLLMLAWYSCIGHGRPSTEDVGTFFRPVGARLNAVKIACGVDIALLVCTEIAMLIHGIKQRRGFCTAKRGSFIRRGNRKFVVRRILNLSFGIFSGFVMGTFFQLGDLCTIGTVLPDQLAQNCKNLTPFVGCVVYVVLRLFVFCIVTWQRNVPYVPGSPSWLKAHPALEDLPSPPRTMVVDTSFINITHDETSSPIKRLSQYWRRRYADLVWTFVLLVCFLFEVGFLIPMISAMDFGVFCGRACASQKWPYEIHMFSISLHVLPSECVACAGAMSISYALVFLTSFLDIHFVFYIANGICGYVMGESRGLRNVMSLALRHVDLSASITTAGSGGGQVISKSEVWTALSDGRAMECVFGSSWRMLWSRLVESLYDDCAISDRMANQMVRAARTLRWRSVVQSKRESPIDDGGSGGAPSFTLGSDSATFGDQGGCQGPAVAAPGDRYVGLRFKATVLRSHAWRQAGLTCCIKELHVKYGPRAVPVTVPVSQSAMRTVEVKDFKSHRELVENLDDSLRAKCDLPQLGLRQGWQLHSSGAAVMDFEAPSHQNSIEQNLLAVVNVSLRESTVYPLRVVFVDVQTFKEVMVSFERPRRVHAVSFTTSDEDPRFDPVRWEVEASTDGTTWRRLQTQDSDFPTPLERGTSIRTFFASEPWRQESMDFVPTSVDLRALPSRVSERLCFFVNSLRGLLSDRQYPVRSGVDTFMDSSLGAIPSLTQIIPVFNEQVILSEEFLCARQGGTTNLAFIISQSVEEWGYFAAMQDSAPDELYKTFASGDLGRWAQRASHSGNTPLGQEIGGVILQVRLWASMRSQSLFRTVAGAIRYHEALEILPCVQATSDPMKTVGSLVQLLIAHQTFGNRSFPEEVDMDVINLLRTYKKYPVFLVIDYEAGKAREFLKSLVARHLLTNHKYNGSVQYASILCSYDESAEGEAMALVIVELLPRCYPLVLSERHQKRSSKRSQGKAANQLGALRFARGHYLQMMDSNMGAFFGEACKVPFALRRFQPPGSDRRSTEKRIIGFREHIFTHRYGAVGESMADAEWTFGTISQRFLAGLGARMHYGHPDFFDAFWASNRGSVSKASPTINLSEDIFAGFSVLMRGERSEHVDFLEWEKGREVSFNKASLFFTKVSSGNVGVMRSRDLKAITENLNVTGSFSFYFASVGFYICNIFVDVSMQIYLIVFVLLTLASKSLNDVGELGSLLAVEWIVSFGVFAMFPRLMELILEYGVMEGLVRFFPGIPASLVIFAFMNKSVASSAVKSMRCGEANYISTGRPNANSHYTWRECYLLYRESHYYPAMRVILIFVLYRLLSQQFGTAALPMIVLNTTAMCWLLAPIVFCPQPTFDSIKDDLSEFWSFCIGTGAAGQPLSQNGPMEDRLCYGATDPRANLYDVWLRDSLEHRHDPLFARLFELAFRIIRLVIFAAMVYALMVDTMKFAFLLFIMNYCSLTVWRFCGRPAVLMMLTFCFWLIVMLLIWEGTLDAAMPGSLIIAFMLMFEVLAVFERVVLLMACLILKPDSEAAAMSEESEAERRCKQGALARLATYDQLVEYFYLHTMTYQFHLYRALFVLVLDFLTQFLLAAVDMVGGVHSWWLLNGNFRGGCCMIKRPAYEPKARDREGTTANQRETHEGDRLRKLAQLAERPPNPYHNPYGAPLLNIAQPGGISSETSGFPGAAVPQTPPRKPLAAPCPPPPFQASKGSVEVEAQRAPPRTSTESASTAPSRQSSRGIASAAAAARPTAPDAMGYAELEGWGNDRAAPVAASSGELPTEQLAETIASVENRNA